MEVPHSRRWFKHTLICPRCSFTFSGDRPFTACHPSGSMSEETAIPIRMPASTRCTTCWSLDLHLKAPPIIPWARLEAFCPECGRYGGQSQPFQALWCLERQKSVALACLHDTPDKAKVVLRFEPCSQQCRKGYESALLVHNPWNTPFPIWNTQPGPFAVWKMQAAQVPAAAAYPFCDDEVTTMSPDAPNADNANKISSGSLCRHVTEDDTAVPHIKEPSSPDSTEDIVDCDDVKDLDYRENEIRETRATRTSRGKGAPAAAAASQGRNLGHQRIPMSRSNTPTGQPSNASSSSHGLMFDWGSAAMPLEERKAILKEHERRRWTCTRRDYKHRGKLCAKKHAMLTRFWYELMEHNAEVHGDEWGCLYCGEFFADGDVWKAHMATKHKGALSARELKRPYPPFTKIDEFARDFVSGTGYKEELNYGR